MVNGREVRIPANFSKLESPFIIAEIGKNFIQTKEDQSIDDYIINAKELIRRAKIAGADAVKFQTHNFLDEQVNIENVVSPHFSGSDRYNWVKRNTLATPIRFWQEINDYCQSLGILFFSTPMSRGAAIILNELGVPLWKVGSGDILDFVLLDYLASTKKPIIISTGMSTLEEIDLMVEFLKSRNADIVLMHCVSKYPCIGTELNLRTIDFLRKRYDLPVGFSDHSLGSESALAACQLGAVIIEKHFSLSRDFYGSDHKSSMLPLEFGSMVNRIRNGEMSSLKDLGSEEKILQDDEAVFRPYFRKTLVYSNDLKKGHKLEAKDIYAMRPQKHLFGLPSQDYEKVLGNIINHDVSKYEPIKSDDILNMSTVSKRKICFVMTSFIHYSRNILVLEELNRNPDVELHIIIGGSALLPQYTTSYGNLKDFLSKEGFKNIHEVFFYLDGDKIISKAKTCGLGIIEFSSIYNVLKPDVVVVRGDRFEVLAAALAAVYMNIPVAHIEGGDVTGTLDESVRHAISKVSHIHFATNEAAKNRIIQMGENPRYVFNYGSPDVEVVSKMALSPDIDLIDSHTGSGHEINFQKPYLMVMFHPVTTELEEVSRHTKMLLNVIKKINLPTIWFWPNVDAGAEEISHQLRKFKEDEHDHEIRFMRYLPPKQFLYLLKNTMCLIGNSSAGIKECSFLGIPVVNLGTRQNNRLRADNVLDVEMTEADIENGIRKQLAFGKYPSSNIYAGNDTSKKIADTLAGIDLYIQKNFFQKLNILGVVTARGGSKGIPKKNIKEFNGKPLIAHSIEVAKQSKLITDVIISTDDEEIAQVARSFGAEVPFIRPAELATDEAGHLEVMQHAINFMEKRNNLIYDYVVILQPTSPLRNLDDLDGTIDKLIKSNADSAVSLVEILNNHPLKAKKMDGDRVLPYFDVEPEGIRRQNLPKAYKRSGAVYAMKRDLIVKDNKLYGQNIVGYEVPPERSIDIDNYSDWLLAEELIKQQQKNNNN